MPEALMSSLGIACPIQDATLVLGNSGQDMLDSFGLAAGSHVKTPVVDEVPCVRE